MNNSFKELLKEEAKDLQIKEYSRVYSIKNLPKQSCNEILILGKSNSGKSTLINTLLNHSISKVSKKPGCTKWIGFIKLMNLVLVDIPGYGFANVSKGRKVFWDKMVSEYIDTNRASLALILIDSRRGIQEIDADVASMFENSKYIFTKIDQKESFVPDNIIGCSSKNGKGIQELRKMICTLCKTE